VEFPPAHQQSHKEESPRSRSWNKEELPLQRRWFVLVLKDGDVQLAFPSLTCHVALAASLQPCVPSSLASASMAGTVPGAQPPGPSRLLHARAQASGFTSHPLQRTDLSRLPSALERVWCLAGRGISFSPVSRVESCTRDPGQPPPLQWLMAIPARWRA